jgi:hypothetical protein
MAVVATQNAIDTATSTRVLRFRHSGMRSRPRPLSRARLRAPHTVRPPRCRAGLTRSVRFLQLAYDVPPLAVEQDARSPRWNMSARALEHHSLARCARPRTGNVLRRRDLISRACGNLLDAILILLGSGAVGPRSAVRKSVSLFFLVDPARGHKRTEGLVDLVRVAAELVPEFRILAKLE